MGECERTFMLRIPERLLTAKRPVCRMCKGRGSVLLVLPDYAGEAQCPICHPYPLVVVDEWDDGKAIRMHLPGGKSIELSVMDFMDAIQSKEEQEQQ